MRFESKVFEVKDYFLSGFFRKAGLMLSNPYVSQYQGNRQEEQPQTRVARAGVDAGLTHLPKTGFDAEAFPIEFADLRRTAMNAPRGEKQFLAFSFPRFAIPVMAVVHANRDVELPLLAVLHGMGVPARRLPLDPLQSGRFHACLGRASAKHHRHQERQFFLLKKLDDRGGEKTPDPPKYA